LKRTFAIGDIHGCSKTFRKLLEELRVSRQDEIYCVGDYIDRGSGSKSVIDLILELRAHGYTIHTLRGNHEQLLLDSVKGEQHFRNWMMNGGNTTLQSFYASSVNGLDPVYLDFFKNTQYFIETDTCIFVHAGLNFSLPDPFLDTQAMLWIRGFSYDREKLHGKILIHGHTPVPLSFILSQVNSDVINIDAGCVYNYREGFGNLVALDVNERKIISVRNVD